jgi:rhodanese-related sulfurtransferase
MVELKRGDVGSVVVVGAGFIGIETAENLRERGVGVTLVEKAGQVMPMLDPEMAAMLHEELEARGIDVLIGTGLAGIEATENGLRVRLDDGGVVDTQMVILSIGVKPELQLARAAGLTIGEQGGIVVDAQMRTSDPRIFAVGDAVEILNRVTGRTQRIALAGPANRQGRLVADVIAGRDVRYPGALGTSIVKVFGLAAASTGLTEQQARRAGVEYEVAWVHGSSHASYYPGAKPMTLKALFAPRDGRLLGAQAVGAEGVDKRMDVLATALYAGQTMFDLEWLDLSYAPPYSSAKDPVNQLATVAAGMLRGDHPSVRWYDVDDRIAAGAQVIDVRSAPEVASLGTLPGAINVPIDELRSRLPEIPRDRDLLLLCEAGLRGYIAGRALSQRGYRVWNVLGGHKLYRAAARSSSRRRVG